MSKNYATTIYGTQPIDERRGKPMYLSNPSLEELKIDERNGKPVMLQGSKSVLMDSRTRELTGEGTVAFVEREYLD